MMKICLICRKFDEDSGSAIWIYAEKLSKELKERGIEVYEIEQKNFGGENNRYCKLFHDWIRIPLKCLELYLFRGVKKFHFLSENQAMVVPLLNFLGAETIASFNDLMRTMGRKDRYFNLIYFLASKAKTLRSRVNSLSRYGGSTAPSHQLGISCPVRCSNVGNTSTALVAS